MIEPFGPVTSRSAREASGGLLVSLPYEYTNCRTPGNVAPLRGGKEEEEETSSVGRGRARGTEGDGRRSPGGRLLLPVMDEGPPTASRGEVKEGRNVIGRVGEGGGSNKFVQR